MNTKEFYRALATKTGMTYADSKLVVNEMIDLIIETVPAEDVLLKNLGKFTVSRLKERKVKLNDKVIDAKSKDKPIFKPSLEFRWAVEDNCNRD